MDFNQKYFLNIFNNNELGGEESFSKKYVSGRRGLLYYLPPLGGVSNIST